MSARASSFVDFPPWLRSPKAWLWLGLAAVTGGLLLCATLLPFPSLSSEALVRIAAFAGVFAVLALAEVLVPRRRLSVGKPLRWLNNIALVFLNTIVARIVVPVGAVSAAIIAGEEGWGLFNNWQPPFWLAVVLSVVILDFIIYLQHVLFHAIPALWRLHRVHHADLDFDVTTGLRFHTLEIIISLGIKVAAVAALGAPALGVLIFEVLLNATAMFNHANVRLPGWLDRVLRLVVVTPDMHRVHHSVLRHETNSNFGFNLPWWDLLLGTYRRQPAKGHEGMTIGLEQFRDEQRVERLPGMLAMPFVDGGEAFVDQASRPDTSPRELQNT